MEKEKEMLQRLVVAGYMHTDTTENHADWSIFANFSASGVEAQARLSFASASNSPSPRIILSRRLTFDLRSPYRKLNKALVDVA